MKAAQYAKYFIRIILAICAIAILFTIVHVMTPKIDVFSCVGVHWTAEHPQEVTCTFHPDFFAEKVLELKPKADIQDVENLAKSIQVGIVSGICKFCGFSCAVGIAAVIAGYPHAFFGKQSAEGKADFSCSNNANVHAVTRFLWCDAT